MTKKNLPKAWTAEERTFVRNSPRKNIDEEFNRIFQYRQGANIVAMWHYLHTKEQNTTPSSRDRHERVFTDDQISVLTSGKSEIDILDDFRNKFKNVAIPRNLDTFKNWIRIATRDKKENPEQISNKSITCNRCRYTWDYTGSGKWYVTCPRCYTKVRLSKPTNGIVEPNPPKKPEANVREIKTLQREDSLPDVGVLIVKLIHTSSEQTEILKEVLALIKKNNDISTEMLGEFKVAKELNAKRLEVLKVDK